MRHRLGNVSARLPEGCPTCRTWPPVWLMTNSDPEPPEQCAQCGRRLAGLVRVYVTDVDAADI
jgi:hypothetical protein